MGRGDQEKTKVQLIAELDKLRRKLGKMEKAAAAGPGRKKSLPGSITSGDDEDPKPSRILVIDDSRVVREALQVELTRAGYETVLATSGKQGLEKLKPDVSLILLDLHMPDLDGMEVLHRIRANPATISVPVIMLTAMADLDSRIEAFSAGADDYLLKPYHSSELRARIGRILDRKNMQAQVQRESGRRRIVEERLSKSEQLYQALFEQAGDGIFMLDTGGRIVSVNESFAQMHGFTVEEMLRLGLAGLDVEGTSPVPERVRRIMAGETLTFEVQHYHKDGHTFPLEVKTNLLTLGSEQLILAVHRDISGRKVAQEELIASERRFRSIVESSPLGIHMYELAEDGRLVFIGSNPAADRILGVDHSGFVGQTIEESFPPLAGTEVPKRYREAARDGTVWHTGQIDYDDDEILGAFEVTAFQTSPGRMVSMFADVTERKRAIAALKESEERYRAIIHTSLDGFWVVDMNGRLLEVNDAYCLMSGYPREALLSKSIQDLELQEGPDEIQSHIDEIILRGWDRFETRHRQVDGDIIEVAMSVIHLASRNQMLCFIKDITEVKRAEQRIIDEHDFTSNLLNRMNQGLAIIDNEGRQTLVNKELCSMTGFTEAELLYQRPPFKYWAEEGMDEISLAFEKTTMGLEGEYELRFKRKDGERFWALVAPRAITDLTGKKVFVATVKDITDRKRAEDALLSSEARLQNAQQLAQVGDWEWNIETQTLSWSDEIYRIFGLAPRVFAPSVEAFEATIHPDDREDFLCRRRQMLDEKQSACIDHRIILPDGEVRYVQELAQLVVDAKGQTTRVIGTVQDITDRKRAENELRESEERWQFALEGPGDGVWDWDMTSDRVFFSRQWKAMLGFEESEIGDRFDEWETRVHPDDLDRVMKVIDRHFAGEIPAYSSEHRLRCKDGSYKWILTRGKVLRRAVDGQPLRAIGTHTDITDRKRAEDRIQRERDQAQMYLDMAGVALIALDLNGVIILANKRCCDLLGEREENLLGEPWFDRFVPPEQRSNVKAVFTELMAGRMDSYVEHFENFVVTASGESRIVNWHNTVMRDDQGRIIGSFSSGEDVTEIRAAEQKLADEQAETRRLMEFQELVLDNMGSGIMVTDTHGDLILANPQCLRILGIQGPSPIGTMVSALAPGLEAMLDPKFGGNEIVLHRPDEADMILGFNRNPIRDEAGEPVGTVVIFQNITDLKRASEALQESENLLRKAQEMAHVGHFKFNPHTGTVEGSDELFQIFGLSREEFQFSDFVTSVHPEQRDFVVGAIQSSIDNQKSYDIEHYLVMRDGQQKYIRAIGEPLISADGSTKLMIGVVQDLTDRKRAEEALRESEARVQRKLQAIISPEEDIGSLELEDIINVRAIQELMDKFYELTHVPVAVIDLAGKILVGTGWQDICTQFHRVHPETQKNCLECDLELTRGVPSGTFKTYICKNGLRDCATPLVVGGKHVGNLFTGQFFFQQDKPDENFFRAQAVRYGFDEDAYMDAVRRVPVWNQKIIDVAFEFYARLAIMISELSHRNIVLSRLLEERKRVEEALRESEYWLKESQRVSRVGSYILDAQTGYWTSSEVLDDIFGIDKDYDRNVTGWTELIHPKHRDSMARYFREDVIGAKKTFHREYMIVRKNDGETGWVLGLGQLFFDSNGIPIKMAGTIQDITERKRAEEALRESEETYRALVEGIPDMVMRFDPAGRHVFVSANIEEVVGFPASEFIGKTHREIGFPEPLCRLGENAIRRVFDTGEPLETEFSFQAKRGLLIFNWLLIPEMDSTGRPRTVLTIAHDVTEKKRIEAEKEELQKRIAHTQKLEAIGTLAGGIAHDFNNILGVIIGNSELLLQVDHFADEDSKTDMKLIMEAGQRGQHLVRQILAFSRKEQVEKQAVDINLIAKETAKMLKSLIPSTIKFTWNLPSTPSRILADATQIQQVLINLASNAADAVGNNGEIVMEL